MTISPTRDEKRNPVEAEILDVLEYRWSPRAYSTEHEVDEAELDRLLEAARWAPSAFNSQPWRFVVSRRGGAAHEAVLDALTPYNRQWVPGASVVVIGCAVTQDDSGTPISHAVYDLGQSVAYLTVQAHAQDLSVHQFAGFEPSVIAEAFGLPPQVVPVIGVAIGHRTDASVLTPKLAEREHAPRVRKSIAEITIARDAAPESGSVDE